MQDLTRGGEVCQPHALWTGGWFFVPPLIAVVGLVLTLPRSPRRGTGGGYERAVARALGIRAPSAVLHDCDRPRGELRRRLSRLFRCSSHPAKLPIRRRLRDRHSDLITLGRIRHVVSNQFRA